MRPTRSNLETTFVTFVAVAMITAPAVAQSFTCGGEPRNADVNGAKLHYIECGQGEAVVFVHGGFGDLQTFSAQFETFAKEYRVIAYSRRFHPPNHPPKPGDVYRLQLHVDDLAALIRALDASPAHIVGHSYGGSVALALALEHPELVRSLVLGEPPAWSLVERTAVGKALNDAFIARAVDPARSAFVRGDSVEAVRAFLDGISTSPWVDQLPQSERANLLKKAPEFRLEMLSEPSVYLPPLSCDDVSRLHRPALLVTGERTPAVFVLTNAELERCVDGESHVMIPGVGHDLPTGDPAFFNQAVLAFLQRH